MSNILIFLLTHKICTLSAGLCRGYEGYRQCRTLGSSAPRSWRHWSQLIAIFACVRPGSAGVPPAEKVKKRPRRSRSQNERSYPNANRYKKLRTLRIIVVARGSDGEPGFANVMGLESAEVEGSLLGCRRLQYLIQDIGKSHCRFCQLLVDDRKGIAIVA